VAFGRSSTVLNPFRLEVNELRDWLTITIMAILAVGLTVNGALDLQPSANLKNAESDISV
jgi:hypothetical protein